MAQKLNLNLPSAGSLFSTQEERDDAKREKVIDILCSEIDSFPNHPFQVKIDESTLALTESIKVVGVQTPAVVRKKEDGRYELIAGHRRKMACELAGLETLPCIIRGMSRDEAIVAMVDSNLQREQILPSEKAKSYEMRLEAMKRQGKRTDLTSRPLGAKLEEARSAEQLAEKTEDSARQIHRYIRLNKLIPALLQLVDEGEIAMRPAVELSYLPEEEQRILCENIQGEECTPSHAQAIKLRKFSQERRLNEAVILSIMQEEKPNQAEQLKLPKEKISRFFAPGTSVGKMQDTIVKALELWWQREHSHEAR
jgi:ParB family chromosome partitioning protein